MKKSTTEESRTAVENVGEDSPPVLAKSNGSKNGKSKSANGEIDLTVILTSLQCMRDGETPHASIDAGYQHAVAVLMAVMSYETGRKTQYDHANRAIRTV